MLSVALARTLGPADCVRIALDDYYADISHTSAEERAAVNFDHPDAIDWTLLRAHFQSLMCGRSIQKPCYDFTTHARLSHTETVHPLSVLVFDGIHAMADEVMVGAADLTVYVDAPMGTCWERRRVRDTEERGRSAESVRDQFGQTVWPMAERFILPKRERADVVIDGASSIDVAVETVIGRMGTSATS